MPSPPIARTSLSAVLEKYRFSRLSAGIILAMCAGLLIPALIGVLALASLRQGQMERELKVDLDNKIALLADSLITPIWNYDTAAVKTIAEAYLVDKQIVRVDVKNPNRQQIFTMERPERRIGVSHVATRELARKNETVGFLEMEFDDSQMRSDLNRDRRAYSFILLGQFVLSLTLIVFAIRLWVLNPLRRLSTFSTQLSNGDLDRPVGWSRHDEIGLLALQLDKMREVLRLSFAEQKAILGNVQVGVLFVRDRMIQMANRQAELIFGYEPGRLHGLPTAELYLSDDQARKVSVEAYIAIAKASGRYDNELLMKKADGCSFWAHIRGCAFENSAPHSGSIWVLEDITERKHTEQELSRYREQLEQLVASRTAELELAKKASDTANLAKSAFLANMSHEIRTPLNAIIGLAYLMTQEAPTPGQRERLAKIDTAAKHLLSVLNDILDISKIEAGRVDLELDDFPLSAILDNIRSLIGEQARSKGLRIEIDSDSVPSQLRGDATRLRQALLNYAANAVKFTERGTITLRAILLEDKDDDLLVRFEVQDTGVGIPPDVLQGLFQAFEQADNSTTRKYGGTGLGLAIARRLAWLMGGETGCSSVPGEGSLFWLTAWLKRGRSNTSCLVAGPRQNPESLLRQRHRGVKVLLAEDNEINREVALELLHSVGLSVDTAENGAEAVAKAMRIDYRLILMDMQMPDMDGLEAAQKIRKLPAWENRPIIAMTANAFEEDRHLCEEAGMNDFIVKPVDTDHFFETLLQWLEVGGGGISTNDEASLPNTQALVTKPTDFADELANLPGIDTVVGLRYIAGNKMRYREILQRFHRQYGPEFIDEFRRLRELNDWTTIVRMAHSLKGVARSIGATELGGMAERLEHAVAGFDHLAARREEDLLKAELARVASGLAKLRDTRIEYAEPSPTSRTPVESYKQFVQLLEARDTAAIPALEAFSYAMVASGVDEQVIADIQLAVKRYDFACALDILFRFSHDFLIKAEGKA